MRIAFNQTSTISGGVVTFEVADASGNWYPLEMMATDGTELVVSYTLQQSKNVAFQMNVAGFITFRARLSTVISGTGTVNVSVVAAPSAAEWASYITGIAAGSNTIGGVQVVDSGGTNKLAVNSSGYVTIANTAFTANAGTNLNTSLLALESGGNLAAIKTDLDTLAGAVSSSKVQVNITNTSLAVTIADGSDTTLGAKADAKSTATDTTAVSVMQVLKEISYMEQNPASRAVTNAGTFAVQSTIQTGTNQIGHLEANQSVNVAQINGVTPLMGAGNTGTGSPRVTIATDQAAIATWGMGATGSGVPSGAQYQGAQARSSEISAATNANMVGLVADLVGKLIVLPYANPENFVSGRASATDTTSTSLIAAPASGLRNYITQITVWNSSATSTYVKIQDGSGGTELYDIPAPAGGGATLTLPVPLRQPTTATAIYFAANASANAIVISASGYKGA